MEEKEMQKSNKMPIIAIALVALIGVVGGTFAYFTSEKTFENKFSTGIYQTSITENFQSPENWKPGETISKEVFVSNTGDYDVAVRVSFTEKWTSADGTTNPPLKVDGKDVAIINFTNESDWKKHTDDKYYYQSRVSKNQSTNSFISGVKLNEEIDTDKLGITCGTTYTYEDGSTDTTGTDTEAHGKVKSSLYSCTSDKTGYAGATYVLTITVETMQWDAAASQWGIDNNVIPNIVQTTAGEGA